MKIVEILVATNALIGIAVALGVRAIWRKTKRRATDRFKREHPPTPPDAL